jgi:DNA recombination protein RmuC
MQFLIGILIGIAIAILAVNWFLKRPKPEREEIESKLQAIQDRLSTELRQEMQNMRETLERSRETLGERFERTSHMMQERVKEFTEGITSMKAELTRVGDHVKDVASVQDLFKSPKLRGQWGEETLLHILSQHYPAELYEIQYVFASGEKVDAVLKLPNNTLAPIDAKFPLENFAAMTEATTEQERENAKKAFVQSVKNRIDEIAKKYILPAEGTTDYALMYVPAEAVYYEIVFGVGKDAGLAEYARVKKIIIASPNTLFMALRTIEHWYKDINVGKKTQEILRRIEKIVQNAGKLSEEFDKLGKHLDNARSAYDNTEKRLDIMVEGAQKLVSGAKVKKLDSGEES